MYFAVFHLTFPLFHSQKPFIQKLNQQQYKVVPLNNNAMGII